MESKEPIESKESKDPSNFEHSTFHNPTYTTRILLEPTSPIRGRFATTRKTNDEDLIPPSPPRNRFITTSKSPENIPFLPIIPAESTNNAIETQSRIYSPIPANYNQSSTTPINEITPPSPTREISHEEKTGGSHHENHDEDEDEFWMNTFKQAYDDKTKQGLRHEDAENEACLYADQEVLKQNGGNRNIALLAQYGGSSPQIEFFKAIDYAIDNNVHNQSINITIFNLVKAFLSPIDINARCGERDTEHIPEHFTALHYCCLVKNTDLVRLLLEKGATLMGPELLTLIIQQQHPLDHVTEENKNLEIATMLLDHEHTYDINKDDFELFQKTSMHLLRLRTRGHAERTRNYNKEYKAARKTGLSPKEAMSVASEAPSPDIPPPRDSDGTRLGYVNSIFLANGSTALHNATYRAQPSVVRLLLERGANIDAKTQKGRTPLMLAQETLDDTRRELDRLNATVLPPDAVQDQWRLNRSRNVAQIMVDKLEETISVLNEYSAKKNTKSILIDQLQTTLDLPKDDPNRDPEDTRPKLSGHDGKFIKKIKSYLGGSPQYGGSPQDDFFDAIQQLLDGNLLTNLEKLIGVFIVKPPIDINAENNKGETALAMLDRGIPRHSIPIKKCAKIAQIRVKLVKLLLENGALIGYGPGGRANLVRIVKRYGSKPPKCVENDLDSVRWNTEIENARLKMADLLLMHGSVNRPMGSSRWTPLFYAVWSLDVPYVKLLLKRGANVQAKDRDGKTPLMLLRSINVDSWLRPGDPMSSMWDGRRLVQSTIYEIESILLKHYAKRNTKQRLVDQMGPPNMKDLQVTAELPRGSRIQAEPDDYPIEDGDGMLRKKIKSYLGGKKTRRLRRYRTSALTR
tara:strand:+ start:3797 stop:6373 length:2577 start_codon:yes stop_codon:yes gene_type:complete